jgi:hypothetical protein
MSRLCNGLVVGPFLGVSDARNMYAGLGVLDKRLNFLISNMLSVWQFSLLCQGVDTFQYLPLGTADIWHTTIHASVPVLRACCA